MKVRLKVNLRVKFYYDEKNKPINSKDIKISNRVLVQTGAESMPSIYEALVEYITNVDDSYERMAIEKNEKEWNGDCLIEYDLGGIKNNTILTIKDRAEGMDFETLEKNFGEYGEKQSGKASRGDAGRGAKDSAHIGDVTESIFNDKYSKIMIKSQPRKFQSWVINEKVQKSHRQLIGTQKNGTKVTLEIPYDKSGYHTKPKDIIEKLPTHYALQKILEKGNNSLSIRFEASKEKSHILSYSQPEGTLVHEQNFYVNNYKKYFGEDALVTFKLYKSEIPLDAGMHEDKRFRNWGILVMGKKLSMRSLS